MMKKVSFCHLKSTLMGRTPEATDGKTSTANGDVRLGGEHLSLEVDQSENENLRRTMIKREESSLHPQTKQQHKTNFFRTIRWKLRKNKRTNKNGDVSKSTWNDSRPLKHVNSFGDPQESACNFRSHKVNSKHLSAKRVVCPVPSAKKCVRRESNAVYCDIEEEASDGRQSAPCRSSNDTTTTTRRCQSSSSSEGDVGHVSLCKIESMLRSSCDEDEDDERLTTDRNNWRIAHSFVPIAQSESRMSSSHLPNGCGSLELADSSATSNKLNSCGSAMLVPSYGTSSTSSSDLHLYESVSETPQVGSLALELAKLAKCGWYWGPITRGEAEEKLANQPDGAFLVRDSSDDHYLLSLSFRSYMRTFHTRIEHCNGLFSFYSHPEPDGHASIVELIQQSMNFSQSGAFCYSRSRSPEAPSFPVRLTRPISRFTQVRSLQYLCRFTIRQYTRFDLLQKLPIPSSIKGYLEQRQY